MGHLVERLPHDAPVRLQERWRPPVLAALRGGADAERARGEGECERREQARQPAAPRARIGQHPAQHQRASGEAQRERREPSCAAQQPAEADRETVPCAAAVPTAVEDKRHEHPQRHQPQPEQLALHRRRAPQPQAGQSRRQRQRPAE